MTAITDTTDRKGKMNGTITLAARARAAATARGGLVRVLALSLLVALVVPLLMTVFAPSAHAADDEDRDVHVTVPAGTQSGTRVALDGWGVPRLRSNGRGDLGVTLLVQTPTRLDDEQRDLLRQLAELREETGPEVTVQKQGRGVFGRLRDAFAGQ